MDPNEIILFMHIVCDYVFYMFLCDSRLRRSFLRFPAGVAGAVTRISESSHRRAAIYINSHCHCALTRPRCTNTSALNESDVVMYPYVTTHKTQPRISYEL
jgi:hypothetical protein